MLIKDRIKELRRVRASELLPNPRNWRTHPDRQRSVLHGVLTEIGYADALLARELDDGRLQLVDGHLRAETTPDQDVPVLILDLNQDEADKLLTLLDPIAGLAGTNSDLLSELVFQIETENETVRELLNEMVGNRVNYVIGQGHRYQVVSSDSSDDSLAAQVDELLEEFRDKNDWTRRQQEIMRRQDRDGEAFLRLFPSRKGLMQIRFVEPDQIRTPTQHADDQAMSFGIQTERDDVETVLGYWIEGQLIDASDILHRKRNVDANVKRGIPLLYPVRKNLRRAEKLLRNMSIVAEIQSAIALIRKHSGMKADSIRQFVQNQADGNVSNPATKQTRTFQRFSPGTIIDAGGGTDYEFPIAAIDASRYILVLQAELRAIASRLVMPEFMLSSDASNANYSSTMVAEGPAVRMFERLQYEFIAEDQKLFRRVLRSAIQRGELPSDTLRRISIHAIPPILAVRDRFQEAKADEILYNIGVLSKQTLAMRYGLNPQREEQLQCNCSKDCNKKNNDKNVQ